MTTATTTTPSGSAVSRRRKLPRNSVRLLVSGGFVAFFVVVAVLGPLLQDFDAARTATHDRLLPPMSTTSTGEVAWLGTDQLGRGVLAQVIEGARVSLLVATATILLGGLIGLLVGLAAGYFGGFVDSITMRLADIQLGIPSILLAILIAGVLGPSVLNVIITLAITRWVLFARVVRASAMTTSSREFVDSVRVAGGGTIYILRTYILPFCMTSLMVIATAQVGLMIIAEASLSFLGLGVPLTETSWGSVIANGRDYLNTAWWIATFPGLAIVATVVSIGFLSDELRDRLDPNVNPDQSR